MDADTETPKQWARRMLMDFETAPRLAERERIGLELAAVKARADAPRPRSPRDVQIEKAAQSLLLSVTHDNLYPGRCRCVFCTLTAALAMPEPDHA